MDTRHESIETRLDTPTAASSRYFGAMRSEGMDFVSSPIDFNDYYAPEYFVKDPQRGPRKEALPLAPESYQTAQLGNRSLGFLRARNTSKPFLLCTPPPQLSGLASASRKNRRWIPRRWISSLGLRLCA